jgi:hypothetical protein
MRLFRAEPPEDEAGGVFRFNSSDCQAESHQEGEDGLYLFNLDTTGLPAGQYELLFKIAGDPLPHQVPIQVR